MLTDTAIKKAKAADKPVKLTDEKGLFLLMHPNGSKYWRLKYRFDGKQKELALGVYPDISLAAARQRRDEARTLLAHGTDPSEQKKIEKRERTLAVTNSFKAVALAWIENIRPKWSEDHYTYTLRRFEAYAFPVIGNRPISEINAPLLLEMARKIEAKGTIETARKVVMACGQVFRFGVSTGVCEEDPTKNLKGALKPKPAVQHMAALPLKELPALIRKIDRYSVDHGDKQTELALKLLMLTFVRTGELREATWDEFDLDKSIWTIPAERMKMGITHQVPLSRQAINIIQQLKELNGTYTFAFPGRNPAKPMSKNTVLFALYRMGYHSRMTGHGFRAVASSQLNEMGFNPDAVERQLAHRESNKVRAAYHRSEYMAERTKMMQHWANYLDGLAAGGDVVPLHAEAA